MADNNPLRLVCWCQPLVIGSGVFFFPFIFAIYRRSLYIWFDCIFFCKDLEFIVLCFDHFFFFKKKWGLYDGGYLWCIDSMYLFMFIYMLCTTNLKICKWLGPGLFYFLKGFLFLIKPGFVWGWVWVWWIDNACMKLGRLPSGWCHVDWNVFVLCRFICLGFYWYLLS